MLPKTSAYIKSYVSETKWMHFLIEDDELFKKNMIFGMKLANRIKKNLTATLSTIKIF